MNRRLRALTMGILFTPALLLTRAASPAPPEAEVEGTVVSVRGDILVVRPTLRPVLTRVSVGPDAHVLTQESVGVGRLRPGMRIEIGARLASGGALHVRRLSASATRTGPMAEKTNGLEIDKRRGRAYGFGTLVRVRPFTFTDDAGHRYTATLEGLDDITLYRPAGRRDLLIGVSLDAQGPVSPDGVVQARTVSVDSQLARKGTMFGAIVGVGATLHVRPRYSTDVLPVAVAPGCTWQRQTSLDPDSLPVGSAVTFWGRPGQAPDTLEAQALLVGGQRYPAADSSQGQQSLSGRLAALDPVTLSLPGGRTVRIIVPAQMPIARLSTVSADDVKPGESAMLILSRLPDGRFQTTAVVLDASPWAGYGG